MRRAVATLSLSRDAVESCTRKHPREPGVLREPGGAALASGRLELRRFSRFLVVGSGGTVIDFGLLALLQAVGVPTLVANSVSFTAGACSNFFWNRLWTFAGSRARPWTVQLGQFLAVSLVALALNDAIVVLLGDPLGSVMARPHWGYAAAKILATAVAVIWNFLGNRFWTFRILPGPSQSQPSPGGHGEDAA